MCNVVYERGAGVVFAQEESIIHDFGGSCFVGLAVACWLLAGPSSMRVERDAGILSSGCVGRSYL